MDARAVTPIRRKHVLSGQIEPDGSIAISNDPLDSTPKLSPSLVRKATEGQAIADANIEISNGPVDSTSKLSPRLVRKATGQVTADGNIEIENGLVESMRLPNAMSNGLVSMPKPSPSLVRKATEGQVAKKEPDVAVVALGGTLTATEDNPALTSPLSVRSETLEDLSLHRATNESSVRDHAKATGQATSNGSNEFSNSFAESIPKRATNLMSSLVESTLKSHPSLVRKATKGQVPVDFSTENSHSFVDSIPKLSPSLVRKATEQMPIDASIENSHVDSTVQAAPSVARKAGELYRMEGKEARHQSDSATEFEPSESYRGVTNGQASTDGSIEILDGSIASTHKLAPSLVRKAIEMHVNTDASIEVSHGPTEPTHKLPTSLVRKVADQVNVDGSIESSQVDSKLQVAPGVARKAKELYRMEGKESRQQLDTKTNPEPSEANSEKKHEPEVGVVDATADRFISLGGILTAARPESLEDLFAFQAINDSNVSSGTFSLRENRKAAESAPWWNSSTESHASFVQQPATTAAPGMITTPLLAAAGPSPAESEGVFTLTNLFLSVFIMVLSFICVISVRNFSRNVAATSSTDPNRSRQVRSPSLSRVRLSRAGSFRGGDGVGSEQLGFDRLQSDRSGDPAPGGRRIQRAQSSHRIQRTPTSPS